MAPFSHHVNSWVSVGLLACMTLWVIIFYIIESWNVMNGNIPNYQIYYGITKE